MSIMALTGGRSKIVMTRHDSLPAEHFEQLVMDKYRGATDEETIVMAEEFRLDYLNHFFLYSDEFVLDGETNEVWQLHDLDMLKLAMLADMMGEPGFKKKGALNRRSDEADSR